MPSRYAPGLARSAVRFALVRLVSNLQTAVRAWAGRARQRRALAKLDERLLTDIGVNRLQAKAEAGKPFWLE